MYLVTAYRWGWVNNHQYLVYGGNDRTKAIALAQAEESDRGGKYGCAVYAFDDDGTDYKLEAYFPSTYAEEEPYHNDRIDMFERLGHVLYSAADGTVYLPSDEEKDILKPTKIEPPEWVISEVKRAEELAEMMLQARKG